MSPEPLGLQCTPGCAPCQDRSQKAHVLKSLPQPRKPGAPAPQLRQMEPRLQAAACVRLVVSEVWEGVSGSSTRLASCPASPGCHHFLFRELFPLPHEWPYQGSCSHILTPGSLLSLPPLSLSPEGHSSSSVPKSAHEGQLNTSGTARMPRFKCRAQNRN